MVSDYRPDQEAVDWAHDAAKRVLTRWQQYAEQQRHRPPGEDPLARPHPAYWDGYRAALGIVRGELGIDGRGCVVHEFDRRGPRLRAMLDD